jgi:hypothetical protein
MIYLCRRTEASIAQGIFVGEMADLSIKVKKTTQLLTEDEEVSR